MVKHRKKILAAVLFFVFFIVTGVFGLLFYIHTDHAGRQIQARINHRIPGQITFQDYSPALNQGKIELGEILLKDPEGQMITTIDRLMVRISWTQLLSGKIVVEKALVENPNLKLSVDARDRLNLARAFIWPESEKEPEPQKAPEKKRFFNLEIKSFLWKTQRYILNICPKMFMPVWRVYGSIVLETWKKMNGAWICPPTGGPGKIPEAGWTSRVCFYPLASMGNRSKMPTLVSKRPLPRFQ